MTKTPPKILTIAGFDSSGGAGIQADLKTFTVLGCYGMSVLTALPIQNTTGVKNCYSIPLNAIEEQLDVIFTDIRPNVIKIGMLFNTEIIQLIASFLKRYAISIPIVLDPVMVAKSGDPLLLPDAIDSLKQLLLPITTVVTPNLPEASVLSGMSIANEQEMTTAAEKILALGPKAVFIKGGHLLAQQAADLLLTREHEKTWLTTQRIESKNTHGTGCTLSAAIASYLALGFSLKESCEKAKAYLTKAIADAKAWKIGKGLGPVSHFLHAE